MVKALNASLDRDLSAMLEQHNGGQMWNLFVYGVGGGVEDLVFRNQSMRRLSEDLPLLTDFILFAQVGHEAAHLASVPKLAARDGTQPVVYLDLSEDLLAYPIASSVNLSFDLYARYIEALNEHYGEVASDTSEMRFPLRVPGLVGSDANLVKMLSAKRFDPYTNNRPDVQTWLAKVHEAA